MIERGQALAALSADEFDVVVRHSKWLAHLGDWAYTTALFINTHFNAARRKLGLPYWSFSAWAKLKVKNAVNFIGSFEKEVASEARRRGVDGVVCGHIHHPKIREFDGIIYANIGDFSRGETVPSETLGVGDASLANQSFMLKKKPLTYVS